MRKKIKARKVVRRGQPVRKVIRRIAKHPVRGTLKLTVKQQRREYRLYLHARAKRWQAAIALHDRRFSNSGHTIPSEFIREQNELIASYGRWNRLACYHENRLVRSMSKRQLKRTEAEVMANE